MEFHLNLHGLVTQRRVWQTRAGPGVDERPVHWIQIDCTFGARDYGHLAAHISCQHMLSFMLGHTERLCVTEDPRHLAENLATLRQLFPSSAHIDGVMFEKCFKGIVFVFIYIYIERDGDNVIMLLTRFQPQQGG